MAQADTRDATRRIRWEILKAMAMIALAAVAVAAMGRFADVFHPQRVLVTVVFDAPRPR